MEDLIIKIIENAIILVTGFLLGSIPFAVILPKFFFGIDVREFGSKNPGTTNVYRVLNEKTTKSQAILMTICIGLLDIGKGCIPALLFNNYSQLSSYHQTKLCLAGVLGHIYSPLLGWNGGIGVATFLGAFIGSMKSPLSIIAPVLWITLTFNKKLLNFIPWTQSLSIGDSLNLGRIKIRRSFFVSLICMSISLTFLLFSSSIGLEEKIEFMIMYILVTCLHLGSMSIPWDEGFLNLGRIKIRRSLLILLICTSFFAIQALLKGQILNVVGLCIVALTIYFGKISIATIEKKFTLTSIITNIFLLVFLCSNLSGLWSYTRHILRHNYLLEVKDVSANNLPAK